MARVAAFPSSVSRRVRRRALASSTSSWRSWSNTANVGFAVNLDLFTFELKSFFR